MCQPLLCRILHLLKTCLTIPTVCPLHSSPLYSLWSQQPCALFIQSPQEENQNMCECSTRPAGKMWKTTLGKKKERKFQRVPGTHQHRPILGQTAEGAGRSGGWARTTLKPWRSQEHCSELHPELYPQKERDSHHTEASDDNINNRFELPPVALLCCRCGPSLKDQWCPACCYEVLSS